MKSIKTLENNNMQFLFKCNENIIEEARTYLEMLEEYIRKNNELIDEIRQEAIEVSIDEALGSNAIKIDLLISNIDTNLSNLIATSENIEGTILHSIETK